MPVAPPKNAELKYHGKFMDFWAWPQRQFDGSIEWYECVTRQDTTTVIAFLDPQTVLLTKQFQPQRETPFFDVPGGKIEAGEDMQAGALREFQEETGYQAKRVVEWQRIEDRSMSRNETGIYLATDLSSGHPMQSDAGERIELIPTAWSDLVRMCLKRELRQPNVMLAILAMEYDPETKARLHEWLRSV